MAVIGYRVTVLNKDGSDSIRYTVVETISELLAYVRDAAERGWKIRIDPAGTLPELRDESEK